MTSGAALPPGEVDVLVAGGGVLGASIALFLAREGVDVLLIDRSAFHTEASGVNAGNIHQQLLTVGIVDRGWDWYSRYARTVGYNVAASAAWRELAQSLDDDIEMSFIGGLMVGETEDQMRLIERKVEIERAHGAETVVVSRADVQRLAPYASESIRGGAWCPGEGKANPLRAVPAILRAAGRVGARMAALHEIRSVTRENGSFVVATSQNTIRCRRFVNAAGIGGLEIARRMGVELAVAWRAIQMSATEPIGPLLDRLFYHAGVRITMKQTVAGNVLIGGGWPASHDPVTDRCFTLRESIQRSMWAALSVIPRLGNVCLLRSWAGAIFNSADGLPILGEVPGDPGHYVAISNHYGFTLAPLLGRLLAERMSGRAPSMDIAPLCPGRVAIRA